MYHYYCTWRFYFLQLTKQAQKHTSVKNDKYDRIDWPNSYKSINHSNCQGSPNFKYSLWKATKTRNGSSVHPSDKFVRSAWHFQNYFLAIPFHSSSCYIRNIPCFPKAQPEKQTTGSAYAGRKEKSFNQIKFSYEKLSVPPSDPDVFYSLLFFSEIKSTYPIFGNSFKGSDISEHKKVLFLVNLF